MVGFGCFPENGTSPGNGEFSWSKLSAKLMSILMTKKDEYLNCMAQLYEEISSNSQEIKHVMPVVRNRFFHLCNVLDSCHMRPVAVFRAA